MKLFKKVGIGLGVAALAACSYNATTGTITVNLGNTQAEAEAIYKVLGPFANAIPAAQAPYAALGIAVAAYDALPNGTVPAPDAINKLVADFDAVVADVNLAPATQLAINEGLTLISALAEGLTTVPAPATPTPSTSVAAPAVVQAPIPIPMS